MKPKDKRKLETIIRGLRAELRGLKKMSDFRWNTLGAANARATKAETEAAAWKRRFDALLAAIPELREDALMGFRGRFRFGAMYLR